MNTKHQGFTLIEAMVAITILLIGVIGPLSIASRGIADGLYASNQIAANYLAQEAIETVLWQRNNDAYNADDTTGWVTNLDSLSSKCDVPSKPISCIVDARATTFSSIIKKETCLNATTLGNSACDLIYDSSSSVHQYVNPPDAVIDSTIGTIFRRRVYLVPFLIGSEIQELKVVVIVDWSNRGTPQSMTLTERLYPRI